MCDSIANYFHIIRYMILKLNAKESTHPLRSEEKKNNNDRIDNNDRVERRQQRKKRNENKAKICITEGRLSD